MPDLTLPAHSHATLLRRLGVFLHTSVMKYYKSVSFFFLYSSFMRKLGRKRIRRRFFLKKKYICIFLFLSVRFMELSDKPSDAS